jgi:hypothetical protein
LTEKDSTSKAFRIKFIDAPEMSEKDLSLKKLAQESKSELLRLIPPKSIVYFKEYGTDFH